jgi:hypothetical protein
VKYDAKTSMPRALTTYGHPNYQRKTDKKEEMKGLRLYNVALRAILILAVKCTGFYPFIRSHTFAPFLITIST